MLISGRAGDGVAVGGVAAGTVAAVGGVAAGGVAADGLSANGVAAGGVATGSVATAGGDGSPLFLRGVSSAPQKKMGANASAHARARALRNVIFIGFHFSSFRAQGRKSPRSVLNVAKARAERLQRLISRDFLLPPFA